MPSGIPPAKESSKQRSLRIDLLYLRRLDTPGKRLAQWLASKYVWSFLALVAAGAYVGWIGIGGETATAQLSPGPLARAHAALNSKCADCHTAYVSASANGGGVNWLSRQVLGVSAHAHVMDANCSRCHQQEAKPHHSKQLEQEVANCAGCHSDHRGDSANLARPDDRVCTVCHDNIGAHRTGSDLSPPLDSVAFFGRAGEAKPSHPPFRSVPATDVNNFKFNHQLHLLPGQWPRGGDEQDAWTLEKIAAELRPGYKTVSATDRRVQLDCASCHLPQQGEPAAQSGAYMLPIRYVQHCQACHPLDLNVGEPADAGKESNPILLLPHGLKKREIDEFLVGIAAQRKSSSPQPRFPETIRIPGKTPVDEAQREIRQPSFDNTQVNNWRIKIKDVMCAKCHVTESPPPAGSSEERFAQAVGFAPPQLPERWLKHGLFDHRSHLSWASCQECHPQAKAAESLGKPLHDDHQVMIPQIDLCAKCHAPVSTHDKFKASARFDCAECHRYHPGGP